MSQGAGSKVSDRDWQERESQREHLFVGARLLAIRRIRRRLNA